ncbi:MAG: hypothetical protein AB2689_15845 [Candidatus Thiodiazotropha taylori]
MIRMSILILITTFLNLTPSIIYANQIVWEAINSFRLIDPDKYTKNFSISRDETVLNFLQKRMAHKDRKLLPPYDKTFWNPDVSSDQRLPDYYILPEKHSASAELMEAVEGECLWKYNNHAEKINCADVFLFDARTQFGGGSSNLSVKILSTGELIETKATIIDRLILGIGDSYASGEGNPDIPTLISKSGIEKLAKSFKNKKEPGRWMEKESSWVDTESQWLDRQCHRSFFSQHILAALKLASANPHETITIIPLACSGAEILDGVLIPQADPPGGGKSVNESQINFAVKHLCKPESLIKKDRAFYRGYTGDYYGRKKIQTMYRCDEELIRKPDAIFLSVGGNDVGFAPSIAYATLSKYSSNPIGQIAVHITHKYIEPICPKETGRDICKRNKPNAFERIRDWLPEYYQWLSEELHNTGLIKDPSNVYLTAYPNPVFIEDGETFCGKDRSTDLNEQARNKLPQSFIRHRWDLSITQDEMRDLYNGLIKPLYKEMKKSADKFNWTFIDSHIPHILTHGICSGYVRENPATPNYPHIINGTWYPEDPSNIWAYDINRLRWFRNTNDSILFQTDHTKSDINGAYHPDFRAHATIADHLAKKVSENWKNLDLSSSKDVNY